MGASLRTAFATAGAEAVSAHEAFTNRIDEFAAFWAALKSMQVRQSQLIDAVADTSIDRRNVLVYYGMGGIGKTTLSKEFERRLNEIADDELCIVSARFDGDGGLSASQFERWLMGLRAVLGRIVPRSPAFDLVFQSYWNRAHPGVPLDAFLQSDGRLAQLSNAVGLDKQLEDALASIAGVAGESGVVGTTLRTVGAVQRALRDARSQRRLMIECPYFDLLLDAPADEQTLAFLPSLLAWDLASAQQRSDTPLVTVVFVDSVEALDAARNRQAEALLQQWAFLMPNVLFVLTGRDRLDWADRAPGTAGLPYLGPAVWPLLARDNHEIEPRQHLVGALSDHDADGFLRTVLQSGDEPAIPAEIRERIVDGSHGLPLYLDIAVHNFITARLRNDLDPESFGEPFPEVVARMLSDLSESERAALRAATLVSRFDADLIAAGAELAKDASARRLLQRSFVSYSPHEVFPYEIHRLLRESVQTCDSELQDGWSDREWSGAAQRMLEALGRRWRETETIGECESIGAIIVQGLALLEQYDLWDPWIIDIFEHALDAGWWRLFDRALPSAGTARGSAVPVGLAGIAHRRTGTLAVSGALIQEALQKPMPEPARRFLRLHLAHALRNGGSYGQAEVVYRELAHDERLGSRARYQLADIDYLKGRFGHSMDRLAEDDSTPALHIERLRLRGHIQRVSARFADAALSYQSALDHARAQEAHGAIAKALTNLAETWCWTRPEKAAEFCERALRLNEALSNQLELLKLHAVRAAIASDWVSLEADTQRALELTETTGYAAGEIFARVGYAFAAARLGMPERAVEQAQHIDEVVQTLGVYGFWSDIVRCWIPRECSVTGANRLRVLDKMDPILRRWQAVLEATS